MERLQVGRFTFTWLNGGVTHLDGGAMFGVVPKPLWSRKYPFNDNNQIELRTDPILVQADGKNMLIESGIGNNKMSDKMKRNFGVMEESKVVESLRELGLETGDIDYVLMTHLHFDHACGLTKWEEGELVPVFEKASIFATATEWEEMKKPNIRSKNTYWKENWEAVEHQVSTFETEKEILPGLKMVHTGGHSNGHAVIVVEDAGETLIHMADIMPTHAHENVLWVMAYDDYPMTAIGEKQKWMKYGKERDAWYTFYHDAIYRAVKWNNEGKIAEFLKKGE